MRKSLSTFTKALNPSHQEDTADLRRGPWTLEEDNILKNYISRHGEGRWNLLAQCSGLKRTGKSCRLRWLNYLKPDIKRGNLTPQEQLLILQLHSKWGNRWSKIAQHLPGRTDNEIKNYWRTRVQKQARLLKIESNSRSITEAVRNIRKQNFLSHNYMDQYPSYNNLLATFSCPLLGANFTPNFSNISPSESSSTPLTQVTESSSQYNNLNATTSPESSPVPCHVPPIGPLKSPSPTPGGPSGNANSIDRGKNNNVNNAVAVAVHENYDYYHNYDHNKDRAGIEDNFYIVGSGSYDMEEFPMHTTYGTGDLYDMSPSTTGCHIEESEWDYSNLPGGYWNMDDIWQFREFDEFGV